MPLNGQRPASPSRPGRYSRWWHPLAVLGGIASLAAALVLSVLLLAVVLVLGALFGGYWWWKTRAVRARGGVPGRRAVIEGEVIRETPSEPPPGQNSRPAAHAHEEAVRAARRGPRA